MNPPSNSKKVGLGPTGETVRENLKRLRGAMQFKELSGRLAEAGRPIPPLGLRRIEAGERRVDADDLMALAMVFDVPPNALLLPHLEDGEDIEVTGISRGISATGLWGWAVGDYPISDEGQTREGRARYRQNSRPYSVPDPYSQAAGEYSDKHELLAPGASDALKDALWEALKPLPHDATSQERAAVVRNLPVIPKYAKKRDDGDS